MLPTRVHYVGTLRPDLIESASILASGKAQVIKTHHNDTDLVRELRSLVSLCVREGVCVWWVWFYIMVC